MTHPASSHNFFSLGTISMETDSIHTVQPLSVSFPKGRLSVVTGVSGSGKTTMILESLIPGLQALLEKKPLPSHVKKIQAEGISQIKLIDAKKHRGFQAARLSGSNLQARWGGGRATPFLFLTSPQSDFTLWMSSPCFQFSVTS